MQYFSNIVRSIADRSTDDTVGILVFALNFFLTRPLMLLLDGWLLVWSEVEGSATRNGVGRGGI
jgi:hypothetical protein